MSTPGNLVDRHVDFVEALRRAGLSVSVAEDLDAATALGVVDLADRTQLRAAYAAALVKRQTQRAAFDTVFDLYFPAVLGMDVPGAGGTGGDAPGPSETAPPPHRDPELAQFRAQLQAALQAGDQEGLARLARGGVGRYGVVSGRTPGTQTWSRYATLNRVSPRTLLAALLEEALYGQERGGLAERVARTTLEARIARFEQLVETEVQRRLAEESGAERVAETAVRPSVERLDLLSATKQDLAAIRREIQPLARRLAARLTVEQRRGRRGPLDFRRTIRASLSSGGIPMQTVHRPRRPTKTDLVILCDVSESVTAFAHFTLLLVYALREQFTRVRVFAFVDDLDEVTDYFRPGTDLVEAVTRVGSEAKVRRWYGRTDYGRAFGVFAERHLDAITSRTSLLILGDARSNYGDPSIGALRAMTERARRAYWLNPERRAIWDTGDSCASQMDEVVPMVECRNLAQLGAFVRDLV